MDDQGQLIERAKAGNRAAQFDLLIHRHGYGNDGVPEPDPDGKRCLQLRAVPSRRILPDVYRRMDLVDEELRAVFRQCVTGQAAWPVFVHGGVGAGKTYAALCLADFADSAAYYSVVDLCDIIMQESPGEVAAMWGKIADKELVILDEIGTRMRVGDLEYGIVKRVLDIREFYAGSVGIYISNVSPDSLKDLYDSRIVSRLGAGSVFQLDGPDRRRNS